MRVGQNPAKAIDHVPQPANITVAIANYIPFLNGYYAQSLEVLKVCLKSLWENTDLPYNLLIFDNASCPPVREFLQEAHQSGRIQFLVLSDQNLGKGGAWNFIFGAAPGEYIAYADSDIYFYPGWLQRSLEILETFPRVGMVTARPLRTNETLFTSTLEWAIQESQQPNSDVRLEKGNFLEWQLYKEHTDSLGMDMEEARRHYDSTADWKITCRGVSALAGAVHFQFTARKSVLQSLLPFQMDRPMGQVRTLDARLNEAGFLRLQTCEPLVKHLGNRLVGSEALAETRSRSPLRQSSHKFGKRLANLPPIRRSLLWLYDQIFRLYYEARR